MSSAAGNGVPGPRRSSKGPTSDCISEARNARLKVASGSTGTRPLYVAARSPTCNDGAYAPAHSSTPARTRPVTTVRGALRSNLPMRTSSQFSVTKQSSSRRTTSSVLARASAMLRLRLRPTVLDQKYSTQQHPAFRDSRTERPASCFDRRRRFGQAVRIREAMNQQRQLQVVLDRAC